MSRKRLHFLLHAALIARIVFFAAPSFAAAPGVSAAGEANGYAQRIDVRLFIDEMVSEHELNRRQLVRWFGAAQFQPKVIAAMERPIAEPPKWFEYAPQFLSTERISRGVAYFNAHEADLARAEREFGVPAEIIVAIIGVETFYGRNVGSYRVFDALTTLAFDYPRRAPFFRDELREFLLLMHEQGISPLAPKGSFAGAMGVAQFMPGSYRRYAIDFDGDGRIDLWDSGADVIGSIAHFLAQHDWRRGQAVLLPATIGTIDRDAITGKLDGGISERRSLVEWQSDGVAADALPSQVPDETIGLLMLEEQPLNGEERASYWIACPNFYALTRYNRSRLYAAAVFQLAQAVKTARDSQVR